MVGKALLNLDMVARILDPDVAPVSIVQDRALELVRGSATPTLSGHAQRGHGGARLRRASAGRVNRAMDALASGKFELRVDAFDETAFLRGLHRMANRIAIGLVLASLIIGAALLSRVKTDVTIGGYPAIAFVLFLLAALGGAWLCLTIALSDRKLRGK